MNRQERRRQNAKNRHSKFVNDYVRHLPEVGADAVGQPGLLHVVYYHDEWCSIYDKPNGTLDDCNCKPIVKYHSEPRRS